MNKAEIEKLAREEAYNQGLDVPYAFMDGALFGYEKALEAVREMVLENMRRKDDAEEFFNNHPEIPGNNASIIAYAAEQCREIIKFIDSLTK